MMAISLQFSLKADDLYSDLTQLDEKNLSTYHVISRHATNKVERCILLPFAGISKLQD